MVPTAFVFLDSLPLLPNGKVNRRALPAPSPTRPALDVPYATPRTPVESTLAGIWAEVLNLEYVGIHDHFLELGGHSLLATRLLRRIIETFRVELSLQAVLDAPTIAQMAEVIVLSQAQAEPDTMARLLAEIEQLARAMEQAPHRGSTPS
jgi:hypothetical protein